MDPAPNYVARERDNVGVSLPTHTHRGEADAGLLLQMLAALIAVGF